MKDEIKETWYLLFDGQSEDGLGRPEYIGRTLDRQKAQEHTNRCDEDPYCTGYTIVVTDTYHGMLV